MACANACEMFLLLERGMMPSRVLKDGFESQAGIKGRTINGGTMQEEQGWEKAARQEDGLLFVKDEIIIIAL
jgi:hypothetical protein